MLGVVFIAAVSFYLYRLLGGVPQLRLRRQEQGQANQAKIEELTEYASRLRGLRKFAKAEKVYMEILNIDHRHVPTYSRLGTLYSLQRSYGDAIECFQMAAQLHPSGTTYYNLGLSLFENRNYIKAISAFEKAIMFEPSLQRYVGLAKAFKKLGDEERSISALEQAIRLEETPKVLWLLADAYAASGRNDDAEATVERIRRLAPRDERLKEMKKARPRRTTASSRG
jgi:tetratricopeptide (TPR) repeat protein